MVLLGILAVPERTEEICRIKEEFKTYFGDTSNIVSFDYEHKGYNANFTNLLEKVCEENEKNVYDYVILCTDDIQITDVNIKSEVNNALANYDVIGLFSNRLSEDKRIHNGTGTHCLYDQCVIYDRKVLNKAYFERFLKYSQSQERNDRERKHFDIMHSHFIRDEGYKIAVIRPNLVKHKAIKSILGHNVKAT